ncbi:MAG: uracil phosphoribosyltransferase [Methanocorpusculum sp.]|nr:uracil phosphoribosyltransferase [Methanocorpusculum sp.]
MSILHIVNHPLIQHKLTIMRNKDTGSKDFRELLNEISMLMGYEVTKNLATVDVSVMTPICETKKPFLATDKIAVVPILRAGLGMTDGLLKLIPFAKVGHIGLYRDETTHEPVEYYCKLPTGIEDFVVIVVDPMLATGGSSSSALTFLKLRGVKDVRLMCLVAAPEGISYVQKYHPDVDIYVAAVDEKLNQDKYIVPGLGDAGDRIFGTK